MSSAVVIVAPSVVPAAAGAIPVLAIAGGAAAAVLAVWAANMAAEQFVRKAGEYGEQLERVALAQQQAGIDSGIWAKTAAQVVELNARITMLEARANRAGALVVIPQRLNLSGCTAVQASTWCVRTAEELIVAQIALAAEVGPKQLDAAARGLPIIGSAAAQAGTADTLRRYQEMMCERYRTGKVPPLPPPGAIEAEVQLALRSVDPDAYEDEHAELLAMAAMVASNSTRRSEARTYLLSLTSGVNAVNQAVAGRRFAAQCLNALEDPIVAGTKTPDLYAGTAAKLRTLISDGGQLIEDLRCEAMGAVRWAADVTHRNYLRELAHECFAGLGYELADGFDVQNSATLEYRRAEWSDEHSAQVWVDEHGAIQGRVLREYAESSDAAAEADEERCADFAEDLQALGRSLDAVVQADAGHRPQVRPGGRTPQPIPGSIPGEVNTNEPDVKHRPIPGGSGN